MKASDIKSNGTGYHTPAMKASGGTLMTTVFLYRMRHSESVIFDKIKNTDNISGRRFNDNENVVARICTSLTSSAYEMFEENFSISQTVEDKDSIVEGIINSFVNSLSGTEMDAIILSALEDCVRADNAELGLKK